MFCRKCGATLEENSSFCESCGAPTSRSASPGVAPTAPPAPRPRAEAHRPAAPQPSYAPPATNATNWILASVMFVAGLLVGGGGAWVVMPQKNSASSPAEESSAGQPAADSSILMQRIAANEASAVGALRALNTVCGQYASTYAGFPPSLDSVGPISPGQEATAARADLIDAALASGQKNGYRFTYRPMDQDGDGTMDAYTINANPLQPGISGRRYFFTDQSGVIRVNKTGPAIVNSPPLQ